MKIKLVIYSKDVEYVEHLANYLNIHHHEKVELGVFNDENSLKEYLDSYRPDIVLLDDEISCEVENNTVIAYLSEYPGTEKDRIYILKYQKGELIYKTILDVYASGTDKGLHSFRTNGQKETKIRLMLSINGGAGASTVAKACAMSLSLYRRALYLNLEMFGDCERVLKADGKFSLDDILYALKSKRGSLALKLESALKKSPEGIEFYAPSVNPINLLELTGEEFLRLLAEMKDSALFDEIVMDMDIFPSDLMIEGMKEADEIWLVADGTAVSNEKYGKFMAFIVALEKKNQLRLRTKMKLFYNKYSRRTANPINNCELEVVGGSPRYEGMEGAAIVKNMADSNEFSKQILQEE